MAKKGGEGAAEVKRFDNTTQMLKGNELASQSMRVWIVLILLPFAGCLDSEKLPPESLDSRSAQTFAELGVIRPIELGIPIVQSGMCDGACAIDVAVPELERGDAMEVHLSWDGTKTTLTSSTPGATRGFDSMRWLLNQTGESSIEFTANGEVSVRARLLGPDLPFLGRNELLPNIVTYAPVQIDFGFCDHVETVEQGASRCLRFGNAIGNTGDGHLQVELPMEQGVLTPAGLGSFDQIISLRDGGETRHTVGNAVFHFTHMHFHYDGFARFSLYEYDEDTGLRGALAAEHKKSGFCFLDWGPMQEPDRAPSEGGYAEAYCLAPNYTGWSMGVSKGWFDFYWRTLTDQYVDADGVPDGTYELVSTADWSDSLLEVDESDNSASTVIRILGDQVEVLESRGHFVMPDGTRNL